MTKPKQKPTPAPIPAADPAAAMHRDVDALAPPPITQVTIDGKGFSISPMRVRQVMPFLKLARPVFAALAAKAASPPAAGLPPASGDRPGGQGGESDPAAQVEVEQLGGLLNDADWMLALVENHGDALIQALAVGTETTPADVGDLTVVGLIVLAKHFVVVNASFFAAQGLSLATVLPAEKLGQLAAGGDPRVAT